jgi:tRNA(Ile)-lysidine synthase
MFVSEYLLSFLKKISNAQQLCLGYSGGLDSTVLLHALLQVPQRNLLRVVHINHSWPGDDAQAAHCLITAKQLGIACEVITVNAQPQSGESLENIARAARYAIFAQLLQPDDCLLTAHQQDDQAETLLLQLMRGAGIKGLAAMAECKPFAQGHHLRPLLNFSRAELQVYAEENKLSWIDDHNNFNLAFNRNFIRHELMPLLKKRWPSAALTLARTARHCAEADALAKELAEEDLENCLLCRGDRRSPADQQGRAPLAPTLSIKNLLQLSPARQRNVLRHWLQQQKISLPSAAQLERIQQDILSSRNDAQPKVGWGKVEMRRHRDELFILPREKK